MHGMAHRDCARQSGDGPCGRQPPQTVHIHLHDTEHHFCCPTSPQCPISRTWVVTRRPSKPLPVVVSAQTLLRCGRNGASCSLFCGPMRAISERVRWNIIRFWEQAGSIRAAAGKASVALGTALRWISRYKSTGGVEEQPKTGRKRALSTAAADTAKELLLEGALSGATAVGRELHRRGLVARPVHGSTVIRAARAAAASEGYPIRVFRGKPVKELAASTRAKRLAFATANKHTHWRFVVFSDRKKFMFWYPGSMVKHVAWCRKGTKPVAKVSSHPMALNVYAALTPKGLTAVHVVAGTSKHSSPFTTKQGKPARNITAAEYKQVLMQTLLPEGSRLMGGAQGSAWVFQQDNDPTHRAAPQIVQAYNKAHGTSISVLANWPPNSPDLNPIENVWAIVQRKVNARGCSTFEEFKQAVIEELASLPQQQISNLYASMPRRINATISSHGDRAPF